MSAVEFGDNREPWAVNRRKVRLWVHALVRDVGALPEVWAAELNDWLAAHNAEAHGRTLLVTRSDAGAYCVHAGEGVVLDVALADLPSWLRQAGPEPESASKPAKAARPKRVAADAVA